jgi:hypothetical protein
MEANAEVMTPKLARGAWDGQMRRVIASVEAPDYDTQRLRIRLPWLTFVACVLAAGGLATLWAIWRVSLTYLWPAYWVALAVCLLITLYLIGSIAQRRSTYPFAWETPEALIVRAASVAGDEALAPLAPTQPAPTADVWGALQTPRIRGLYHQRASLDRKTIATVLITLLIFLFVQMLALMPVIVSAYAAFEDWVTISIAGPLVMVAGIGAVLWRQRLPFGVMVSADGVRWRQALRRRTLRWEDAQALCTVEQEDTINRRSQRIYWLQGPDGALVWASRWVYWPTEPLQGEDSDGVDTSDPAWRFCALAAARTRQPLRDLTATLNSLVTIEPRLAAQWRSLGPSYLAPQGSPAHMRITRLRAAHLWRLQALAAALLALTLALLGAGLGLLVVAPQAYGAQLAWAQRQTPTFHDALTPASGQWTDITGLGSPIFEDFGNASDMLGAFNGNFALAGTRARDGVVEVTVHHVAGSQDDMEGLVLRGDQTRNQALVFTISANGMWALDRVELKPNSLFGSDDSLIRQGIFVPVVALRQGDDAINQLAVIMRGADYTFFINGQYVGSYHETQDTGDRVGVVAESDSMLAGFSDFDVYPAPPTSTLFPV